MARERESLFARWLGVLRLSRRQLQQRWLESVLIVLGLALGVGVLTAGETFVRFQGVANTDMLARHVREWRAVTVQPVRIDPTDALFGEGSVPAVRIDGDMEEEPVQLSLGDVRALRDEVPGLRHVVLQEGATHRTVIGAEGTDLAPPPEDVTEDTPEDVIEGVSEERIVTGGGAVSVDVTVQGMVPSSGDSGDSISLMVDLVTPDEFAFMDMNFVAGGPFTWDNFFDAEYRLVLLERNVPDLFPGEEPADVIGRIVTTGGRFEDGARWTVAGVVSLPEGDETFLGMAFPEEMGKTVFGYAPSTVSAGRSFGMEDALSNDRIYLVPEDEELIPDIIAEAQAYFDLTYGDGRVELRNPVAERAGSVDGLTAGIVALLVLAGLGLLIAAVNVLNLFTARVLRRLRITGMSVALGATRRLLFWQTAGEALLLGALGSALGVAIAAGFVGILRALLFGQLGDFGAETTFFDGLRVGVPDALIGLTAGVGLSLVFGLYPAWLGSRQDPVEALRVE